MIKQGRMKDAKGAVEVVDIETDEGFDQFILEVLEHGDGAVPSAYRDGKRCAIQLDEENDLLVFDCEAPIPPDIPMPIEDSPSEPEG